MITHTTEWKSEEDTPPRPWFRFYDGGHKASEDDMGPFSAGQPESNREFSEKETFEEIGALEGRETEKEEATEEETEEEPVEWDGSEAQLVLEDDAAEYESPQTGIRLSCDLKEKEIFEALRRFPFTKRAGKRAVIEAVLLLLASGLSVFWDENGAGCVFCRGMYHSGGGCAVCALAGPKAHGGPHGEGSEKIACGNGNLPRFHRCGKRRRSVGNSPGWFLRNGGV